MNRTAACSCGQLRLTTTEEPLRVSVCHCLACQRRTGSAFGVQARFRREAVRVEGRSSAWTRVGDEGGVATFHFCPTCSSILHYAYDPDHVAVPVGAFADPCFPSPVRSIYENRQHPWVGLPDGLEHD